MFAFTAISDYEKLYDELKEKDSSRNRRNRFWLHHRHENDDKNEDSNEAKEMTKLRDRIVTLSVENGILSKFTSYVGVENNPHKNLIQEEEIEYDDNEEVIDQPLMAAMPMQRNYMAKGSSRQHFAHAKGASIKRYKALPKRSAHHINRNCERKTEDREEEIDNKLDIDNFMPVIGSMADYEKDEEEMDRASPPRMHYEENRASPPRMHYEENRASPPRMHYEENRASPPRMQFAKMMSFGSAAPSQRSNIEMPRAAPEINNFQFTNEAAPAPRHYEMSNAIMQGACAAPMFYKESSKPSSSSSFTAPPPVKPRIENSVTGIVKSQQFDGRWKSDLFEQLMEFVDSEKRHFLVEFLDSLGVKEDEDGGNIKSTVVALCVLNKSFQSEELKWRQVQRKAVLWLKSKLEKNWEVEIQNLASLI